MAANKRKSAFEKNGSDEKIVSDSLDFNTLSNHLWESANILRGPVDAADFKTYIFPLLFFKRLSDVYDEEFSQALVESNGDAEFASFPENHRFQIPEGCHWTDVRSISKNVGHGLQHAMRCIEQANPDTLHGIFGDAQWTNKERLSDVLLKNLIEHFSGLNFGNANCKADILGQSYEYLIKKFADLTNKKAGEFYTPRSVVSLLVRILSPQPGDTIYDPACGTGGMLLEALHFVKQHGGDKNVMLGKLYGQEKNLTTSSIARMNLFLHGAEDFHIERGDTLRHPAFYSGDSLAVFDCVIANPPFSLEKWGDDIWISDPYGRNFAGLPPSSSGDFAWIQHMVKSMAIKTGRMAVVLPHGVLFRESKEGEIRRSLLKMDILEAVIGLGPNLFYGTGLAACILVFHETKRKEHQRKVLFVNASGEFKTGRAQNELSGDHVAQIHQWFVDYQDVEGICRVVSLAEIEENNFNLSIARYVEPIIEDKELTLPQTLNMLKNSLNAVFAAEDKLFSLLDKAGLSHE
ncbi:SAM-dependent DNA methyltransferase [Candidatus Obscuribacterales bacterium]|nr:SAM-dependent DNA methyltransferase [Candidatus Obscuribacterales bacterium]